MALHSGFATLDLETGEVTQLAQPEGATPGNRFNDGRCDPAGRFWAGSMSLRFRTEPGRGTLYRLAPDGSVTPVLRDITLSNGLGWSPTGDRMYYIDSTAQRVDVLDFDLANGTASNRRPLIEIAAGDGMPDGLTVDADGFLWVAVWGSGTIRRYSPAGELERLVRVPVSQVTSCAFGGRDLEDLYITSEGADMTPEAQRAEPHYGGLFVCRAGVRGLPPAAYGG
jgi:sugar lactone lactonase YvrE